MLKKITLLWIIVLTFGGVKAQTGKLLEPSGLMIDLVAHSDYQSKNGYAVEPSPGNLFDKSIQSVLIGNTNPAFSWEMNSTGKNEMQIAYQILIADDADEISMTGKGNIWDSGKIISSQSAGVLYKGNKIKPGTSYYWTVRVWNNHGQVSPYAEWKLFYTNSVLSAHQTPSYPTQITDQKPLRFSRVDNSYRADFGKDGFGQIKLRLTSDQENDSLTVRIGEIVDANGNINRKPPGNIRYAQYTVKLHKGSDWYKINLKKDPTNTRPLAIKMPAYIGEVTPFRYCEVEDYSGKLNTNDVVRLTAHYQFDDNAVKFHSSDTILNAVWELCKYSMKATSYLGTYVDGDRERLAYEADAYINQLSHYAVDKEYTIARKTHEHLITTSTWPTEWLLQSVLIGWNDYLYTGDLQSAKYFYNDLKAKSLTALEDSTGLISTQNGKITKDLLAAVHFQTSGRPMEDIVDWPHGPETDGFVFTKYNAVVNAYYYKALTVMAKFAADLGNSMDAMWYQQKAVAVKQAYNKLFFDDKQKLFVDGVGTDHASLHTNMFALAFNLVDADRQPAVLAFVKSRGMKCSVYGSQFLLDAVYNAGDGDYGLSLLTSQTDRSWYNMIRVGSTITLEAWDNKYKANQDWNHAWGAAADNIISRKLMGIEPLTPGWTIFIVKPQIGSLTDASIDVPTIKGTIKASYKQTEQWFSADITIPANTKAQVYLPVKRGKKFQIWMDGQALKKQSTLLSNIGSGRHQFKIEYL